MIKLPRPEFRGPPLEVVLTRRRSVRGFALQPLELHQLGQLCFAAMGVTGSAASIPLRTTPSAGGLYPIEVYVVVNRVTGCEVGSYRYLPAAHALEPCAMGEHGPALTAAGLGQRCIGDAAVNFVFTAIPDRTRPRYKDLTERYVNMEAGHAAQNVLLQAVSLGLGAVPIGAFRTSEVNKIVGVDGARENAIYLIPVG